MSSVLLNSICPFLLVVSTVNQMSAFAFVFVRTPSSSSFSRRLSIVKAGGRDPEGPPSGTSYSFVEGSDFFGSPEEEVEAMGGDPFFLETQDETDDEATRIAKQQKVKPKDDSEQNDQPEDTGKFIWDGEVDEDAYFDG